MRINIESYRGNILNLMRQLGYHPNRHGDSFSRSIGNGKFPRFHIYYNKEKKILNLHLDQKAPLYKGAPDHGAEYDTDPVKKEAERIKSCLR